MILKTDRLVLDKMCMKYFSSTHAYSSDPENTRLMMFLPSESSEETKKFIEGAEREWKKTKPTFLIFAVVFEGVHIGAVDLYPDEKYECAEIGWIIDKRYQGRGFAYEAASAMIDYAVKELGIKRFIAHCDTENIASRRTMEKLGMKLNGEHGGRKNRLSDAESREFEYVLDYE